MPGEIPQQFVSNRCIFILQPTQTRSQLLIHPAYIDKMADYGAEAQEATTEELAAMHPLGHMGEPRDVAYAVVYLASEESTFMTGSELVIDGGYTAQ